MQLPTKKYEKIKDLINTAKRKGYLEHKQLQKLQGSARHAAIGAPWTNGLFSPLNDALSKNVAIHRLKKASALLQALDDHLLLARLAAEKPTRIDQVVPKPPDILIFIDASKWAAGGVIHCMRGSFKPMIFK